MSAGGGADLRELTCLVCFDDYPALKGIECDPPGGADGKQPEKHFLCLDCLDGHVQSCVDNEGIEAFVRKGGVCCVDPGCPANPFSDSVLAKALPEETFAKYSKAKEKVAEQRINAELEKGFEERLKKEREKGGAAQARQIVKDHINEKILTLACPRCGQAFLDFQGCMALTCSRAGCGCGFCAMCGEDCGNDAHGHIREGCPYAKPVNQGGVGIKKGEYFCNAAGQWDKVSSKSKANLYNSSF